MQKHPALRVRLNNQIREPQLQVIDSDGKPLGTMPTHEALKLSLEQSLDLVEVGPNAKPPIAKIMDYGKYMYQREKSHRGSQKAPGQEMKTVKIGFKTGQHDMQIRAAKIDEFLQKGHRVRVELALRGREREMVGIGQDKLKSLLTMITQGYSIDDPIKRFPGGLGAIIKPDKH